MTTKRRKFMGPLSDTEWSTGLAYGYGFIDEEVAEELARIPLNPSGEHAPMAEYAALARVAERKAAEGVAYARRNGMTWQWIGERLGVTAQAAQQRYGKLPKPPMLLRADHGPECADTHIPERLRRDRKGWGCKCGAAGELD
jgi:hypothetical protein